MRAMNIEPIVRRGRELTATLNDLEKESDRGLVLIALAYIEETLGELILSCMVDEANARRLLREPNAPLGTLSARIEMAFALGLIGESECQTLKVLKGVRNRISHDFRASFLSPRVIELCKELPKSAEDDARSRFTYAAKRVVTDLYVRQVDASSVHDIFARARRELAEYLDRRPNLDLLL